ncbi:MAG: hypothetical protein AAF615_02410 [Pseudomonadota bacterium]
MRFPVIHLGFLAAVLVAAVAPSQAQSPTAAQRDALRANCAADFRANCSGVSPGGMDALMCLEQNEAKLSSGCKSAVDAVKGPPSAPAPKPAAQSGGSAPAANAAPAASAASAAAPAAPLSFRQEVRVVARSCFRDFKEFCPNLEIGRGNMVRCLRQNADRVSPGCHDAMVAVGSRLR